MKTTDPKVMFLLPSLAGGGAEKVMMDLFQHLHKKGANLALTVLNSDGPYIAKSTPNACLFDLKSKRAITGIFRLKRLFRKEKPAVVFATMAYFNFTVMLALLLARWRPEIVVLREANTPASTLEQSGVASVYRFFYRWLYNRADVIVCNSKEVERQLIVLGVTPQILKRIPNPIDIDHVRYKAKEDSSMPVFKDPELPTYVAIGRLTFQKGFDRLIEWFSKEGSQYNLLIIGDGPQLRELKEAARKLNLGDRLAMLPFQSNPYPFMMKARALLLPSRWEGLPNVALEALAIGCPVVCMKSAGGLNDLVGEIPSHILNIVNDENQFMSKALSVTKRRGSQNWLPERFAFDEVAKQYADVLGIDGVKH